MANSPLFTPPKYHEKVNFHRHTDRTIGWLELFYDLIYVATLIQIGNFLSKNVSLAGFAQFLVLVVVVWWAWTGETFYQNRYVSDDVIHRLLVFVQIAAIAVLGLSVSKAFGELHVQFTIAYVVTRLMLILMYLRAIKFNPDSTVLTRRYVIGFSIGVVVWLSSLLLPAEIHWVGWLLGIAIELAVPLLPETQRLARSFDFDRHHMAERFGIFTIIVLGEAFVKVLEDAQGTAFTLSQAVYSLFGFSVLYSLWWLYFGETQEKVMTPTTSPWKPISWVYGHAPLSVALITFGVAAKKLYGATLDHPEDPVYTPYRLLYTTAVILFLVALALINYGLAEENERNRQGYIYLVAAVLVLLIGLIGTSFSPTIFVALISVVMVGQVALNIYNERKS